MELMVEGVSQPDALAKKRSEQRGEEDPLPIQPDGPIIFRVFMGMTSGENGRQTMNRLFATYSPDCMLIMVKMYDYLNMGTIQFHKLSPGGSTSMDVEQPHYSIHAILASYHVPRFYYLYTGYRV